MGVVSFHFAARHLFPSNVGCAMWVQCRVALVHATAHTAELQSAWSRYRYSELQRSARSFRAERLQLRICSEVVSISARSALIGLVESRAFCGPQALASCVFNVCCERYLCRCTGVGYGTPAQERHAFFCPFHEFEVYKIVSWNDVQHVLRTRSIQKPCVLSRRV